MAETNITSDRSSPKSASPLNTTGAACGLGVLAWVRAKTWRTVLALFLGLAALFVLLLAAMFYFSSAYVRFGAEVSAMAWNPRNSDELAVLYKDGRVDLLTCRGSRIVAGIEQPHRLKLFPPKPYAVQRAISWSPDGSMLVIGGYNEVIGWTVKDGVRLKGIAPEIADSYWDSGAWVWSPDGRRLVLQAGSKNARRLDQWKPDATAARPEEFYNPPPVKNEAFYNMAWSPDGKTLAMNPYNSDCIQLLGVEGGVPGKLKPVHDTFSGSGSNLVWSPDSTCLAGCRTSDNADSTRAGEGTAKGSAITLYIWRIDTQNAKATVVREVLLSTQRLNADDGARIVWSRDGKRICVSVLQVFVRNVGNQSATRMVEHWVDAETGAIVALLPIDVAPVKIPWVNRPIFVAASDAYVVTPDLDRVASGVGWTLNPNLNLSWNLTWSVIRVQPAPPGALAPGNE